MPETLRVIPEEARTPRDTNAEAKEGRRSEFDHLVPLCQAGDKKAWDKLVRLAEPIINETTRRLGVQSHDAADLKQKIIEGLLKGKVERFHGGDFEAWLKVLAKNETLNWYRSEKVRGRYPRQATAGREDSEARSTDTLKSNTPEPDEQLIKAQLEALSKKELNGMLSALRKHNPQAAALFQARYIEEMSPPEIAARYGVEIRTVNSGLFRARKYLKEEEGLDVLEATGGNLKLAA